MNNPNNSPQALSDAALRHVWNTQISLQRDAELSIKHRIDWEQEKRMVLVEPPVALRTAIRARQDAIKRQQAQLEEMAKALYTASLEALKRRYRERRDITGLDYDQMQRDLHNGWQARRVDLARRYVYTFADARLQEIQEASYAAARAAADAVWEREGAALVEQYSMPAPPSWATEPEHAEPGEKTTARRRTAVAAR